MPADGATPGLEYRADRDDPKGEVQRVRVVDAVDDRLEVQEDVPRYRDRGAYERKIHDVDVLDEPRMHRVEKERQDEDRRQKDHFVDLRSGDRLTEDPE